MTEVTRWRLIPPLQTTGAMQMAIDTWLLEQHRQGLQPPSLRFYTWSPAAISLGYHQRHWPEHWQDLCWQGQRLDLVRRPTGGRAVLHQGDLTYAVVLSGLAGGRLQSYQYICEFLLRGWQSLGFKLTYGQTGRGYMQNPNCFMTATAADLVLGSGYKLIGSAQVWRQRAVLQHGSLRLNPDPALNQTVFGRFSQEVVPRLPQQQMLIDALTESAREWFQAQFLTQALSPQEWQAIEALAKGDALLCKPQPRE